MPVNLADGTIDAEIRASFPLLWQAAKCSYNGGAVPHICPYLIASVTL
jgi:hypothetical protein